MKAACAASVLALALSPVAVSAQGGSVSRPVVQALPPEGSEQLSAALQALARNSSDLSALIAAGKATLKLGDLEAAAGFFARASDIDPDNGDALAGRAVLLIRQENPYDALRMFDAAEQAGADLSDLGGERGLAYDLVGDNVRAQRQYREVLEGEDNPEIRRRLALSYAISGDQQQSESVLLRLLQNQDLAAYRTRAFALAVLGKTQDAVAIAEAVMPPTLSSRMTPYLRYMPRLTRSQQAAAGNLGIFPRADQIGKDDPRVAQFVSEQPPRVASRTADARLVPEGKPLGPSAAAPAAVAAPPPAPPAVRVTISPIREEVRLASSAIPRPPEPPRPAVIEPVAEPVQVASAELPPVATLRPAESGRALVGPPVPPDLPGPAAEPVGVAQLESEPAARPGFESVGSTTPAPAPLGLAEAFAEFDGGVEVVRSPAAGAVDITDIEPPREKPPEPEPPKPVHPSRFWVQVATGRDISRLAFDWRRMKREASALLGSRDAYTASWGRTNRLVTGPYGSRKEAMEMVGKLKDADLDSFMFVSKEGEEVRKLP